MTTKNTQSILRQRRDLHLVTQMRRVIQQAHERGERPSMSVVAERAVMQPAPGYYVEYATAQQMMYRNVDQSRRSRLHRAMWQEIHQKARERLDSGHARTMARAVESVLLEEGASRFFISPEQAQRIYNRHRHRRGRGPQPVSPIPPLLL
ncbi:MAG: hypothetical protein LIP02_09040 [Bacteroidales bacterium]|nr:hypothetical protein [Bacteroidales bacterium]